MLVELVCIFCELSLILVGETVCIVSDFGNSLENGVMMRLPKNSSAGDLPSGAEEQGVYR